MYSQEQTEKAAKALLKFVNSGKKEDTSKDLFADVEEDFQTIYLTISTKKFVSDKKQLKPKRVVLPNPLFNKENTSVCLFTKDPQRSYKDALQKDKQAESFGLIERVVGVSKLKGKFKPYQARRSLLSQYDLFLAEDSVVTTLPKLLGKVFYDGSVQHIPVPIKVVDSESKQIDSKLTKKEIEKVLNSTMFVLSPGTTVSVRIGKSTQNAKQIAENVQAVVEYFTSNVTQWDGIRSMHIKTQQSQSLPVFMTENVKTADKDTNEAQEPNKKRDRTQLTDFEEALTEHFENEDLEQFTNKKLKK